LKIFFNHIAPGVDKNFDATVADVSVVKDRVGRVDAANAGDFYGFVFVGGWGLGFGFGFIHIGLIMCLTMCGI